MSEKQIYFCTALLEEWEGKKKVGGSVDKVH